MPGPGVTGLVIETRVAVGASVYNGEIDDRTINQRPHQIFPKWRVR